MHQTNLHGKLGTIFLSHRGKNSFRFSLHKKLFTWGIDFYFYIFLFCFHINVEDQKVNILKELLMQKSKYA
jgi:hypothetical protein